jgi:hypothetical protein
VLRGDAGAGDTELTWNAVGTFGVQVGKSGKHSVRFGYRHLHSKIEQEGRNGSELETEITFSGPLIAYVFKW